MTTYHVYKADCLGASRVVLQSDWEGQRSGFIHLLCPGRAPGDRPELRYGLASILRVLKAASPERPPCLVFHAQSSLPLLFAAYLLRGLFRGGHRATFVYDIHDLHEHEPYRSAFERLRYGMLRYYPLRWLERWAVLRRDIRVMTVSDGLAKIIAVWYGCPVPVVVHSAMNPRRSVAELSATPREPKAILFFGTVERLPFELIDDVGRAGFELHLYGRFGGRAGLERNLGRDVPNHVQVFGEYSPKDLDFVRRYRFLLIYKPDDMRANFRYSLPNKFFQSLAYGTSLILSPNFVEMVQIASTVPGACAVLPGKTGLAKTVTELDRSREGGYWQAIFNLGTSLYDASRRRYLCSTSNWAADGRQTDPS